MDKKKERQCAGVPFHAADTYIARLIEKGYKVAICEQLEDPKQAKGIVKRGVIRVVTPGTVIESNLLDEKKNNYIMAIYKNGTYFGVSVCDISTGDFRTTQITETNNFPKLLDEISRYNPAEIIVNPFMYDSQEEIATIKERFEVYISRVKEEAFQKEETTLTQKYTFLDDHGQPIEDITEKRMAIYSIHGLLEYLVETQKTKLDHINKIILYHTTKYMALDISARRNLEITEKMRDKSKKGTLLWVLDKTCTSMGGRLLRRWLNDPLIDVYEINKRLEAVKELKQDIMLRGETITALKKVYDMERLAGRIAYGNATGRDMISLKNSVKQLPEVKKVLTNTKADFLQELYQELDELTDIYELIEEAIVDEPPMSIKEGGLIKLGYNEEIDHLKQATTQGKTWLVELEAKEREQTRNKRTKSRI